jgi:hypothetical protein
MAHRSAPRPGHLLALVLLLGPACATPGRAGPSAPVVRVERLGELPVSFSDRFGTGWGFGRAARERVAGRAAEADPLLRFSPDGLHMAYVEVTPGGATVLLDGVRGREYPSVGFATFSAEGGHFAYFARPAASGLPTLVMDGAGQPLPQDADALDERSLRLSRDGSRFAYLASHASTLQPRVFVVTERGALGPYEQVDSLLFTWDGRLLFWQRSAYDWRVVEDGREGRRFASFEGIQPDEWGRHVSYRASEPGHASFCRDGTCSSRDPDFLAERWSRDDRHHAELLLSTRGRALRVDGREGEPWEEIVLDSTLFSVTGDRCAYWGRNGGWWTLVIDGARACERIESPGPIRYSDTGDRVAWWGRRSTEWILFVDGVPLWRQVEAPDWTAFTGDGRRVAHLQNWRNAARVVIDSLPEATHRRVETPRLGASGRVAYLALDARLARIVLDGVEGPSLRRWTVPVFSPDGAHVAWAAWSSRDRASIVLDGQPGEEFDTIVPGGPVFRPDGTLEFLALRRGELLRVRHDPPAPRAP